MLFTGRNANYRNTQLTALVLFSLFFSSCLSRKETDYFQGNKKNTESQDIFTMIPVNEPKIQPYDLLNIQISSINPEAARFFNPSDKADGTDSGVPTSYMVDSLGEIEVPVIGRIKVGGLTTRIARDTLRDKVEKFLQNPTIQIYYASFNVTVLGEVKVPGLYNSKTEKMALTDALGMAGDLTIYGDRKKVLLIRESAGKKVISKIDLTSRDIFNSPDYFLKPGDIIYVPAGKGRLASADAFYRIAPIVISSLTLLTIIVYRFNAN